MEEKISNFLTEIIDKDLEEGRVKEIHTRFPPEPNGYLHIGSAKAIWINWSIAKQYGGKFNLRYDDTNPSHEDVEYVDSILEDLRWLGRNPPAASITAAIISTSAMNTPSSSSARARPMWTI